MPKIRLTKTSIEKIPFSENKQVFYLDTSLPGFGLRVGKSAKSFYAEKKVNRKPVRVTIGKYPQINPETARKNAQILLSDMTQGKNPNAEKKNKHTQTITLNQLFDDYMEARRRKHKPRTVENYRRTMRVAFKDWMPREIKTLSKEMISARHIQLGEDQGESQANTHMRVIGALFNFAKVKYEDGSGVPLVAKNPVERLTELEQWYEEKPKTRVIKDHQLGDWYQAVNDLGREMVRDFFLFLLFTGLRKLEAAKLKWTDVDFKGKTIYIVDTKNSNPLTLPLTSVTFKLLQERKKNSGDGEFVFPVPGKVGYFVNPAEYCKQVAQECGVEFSVHDLRRTFITVASRLVTSYELKMIVNHSSGGDVTHGYIISDVENLRQPMQKITNRLLSLCQGEKAKIIEISSGK